jgi:hypothetical protein
MKIELKREDLDLFVRSIDRSISGHKEIFFSIFNGHMTVFCEGNDVAVVWFKELKGDFYGGIESQRFVGMVKNLKSDIVKLKFGKSKINVNCGSFKANFPFSKGFKTFREVRFDKFSKDTSLLDSFKGMSSLMGKDSRYGSLLIDSGRICNFDNTQIYISRHNFNDLERLSLPISACTTIKSLDELTFNGFFCYDDFFGVNVSDNISIIYNMVEDQYPEDYMGALKLDDTTLDGFNSYEFDRVDFLNNAKLIFSTVGDSEMFLKMEIDEDDPELTWLLKNSSYTGIDACQKLTCSGGEKTDKSFGINIKRLIRTLSGFKSNKVWMYDESSYYIILRDEGGQLVLLTKHG